jgi:hypothetical protein
VRGPLEVSAVTGDDPGELSFFNALLRYASGESETLEGRGSLTLRGRPNDIAEVQLRAYLVDSAGNRGLTAERNFVIDPSSIYVSSVFYDFPSGEARGPGGSERGSRGNPLESLDEALELAVRENRRNIRVAGSAQFRRSPELAGDIVIDGSYDAHWESAGVKAAISIAPEAAFALRRGSLELRSLALERREGKAELFRVAPQAELTLADSTITHLGQLIRADPGARCRLEDVRIRSLMGGTERIPVLVSSGAVLGILRCQWELEGRNGLLCELRDGVFQVEDSRFRVSARATGTVLSLRGVDAEFRNLSASVDATDYGTALEIADSKLFMSGGDLAVTARDGVAVISENTDSLYLGTGMGVNASFVSRAMEVRGSFPRVTNCRFSAGGSARRSEVFSAESSPGGKRGGPPVQGESIAGNVFRGFTHLLGNEYSAGDIRGFNRAFAPPDRPNSVEEPEPRGGAG